MLVNPGTKQSQALADLLWVINGPSFVEGTNVAPAMPITAASVDEAALERFLLERQANGRGHRVGHYFEHLLAFWLEHVRGLEMIGAGVQVRDGKRTIGEVDFLYRDEAGVFTHCEASVKFFLHHPRVAMSHYPGPNSADDFERKIAKLFEQQLPLSVEHFPEVQQRHAFVKGMVFYHHGNERPDVRPNRMPEDHLVGRWCRANELAMLRDRTAVRCAIADKPHWLAPDVTASLLTPAAICDQLSDHFEGAGHPVMLSVREENSLREVDRFFVVPNHWPDR